MTTASDGKRYKTKLYNLDLILAIGYRVRSPRGTQFRQWATAHLKEYLIKGLVMDDERLKNPGGWDYFDAKRRRTEASESDAEDLEALEELEKDLKRNKT